MDMLTSLLKKDDTAKILEIDSRTGAVVIESERDLVYEGLLVEEPRLVSPLDSELIQRDVSGILADIPVRIIFVVFCANAVISFLSMLFAFIPYWMLAFDETRHVTYIVLGVWAFLSTTLYILMVWKRRSKLAGPLLIGWAFVWTFLVGILAAIIENITPIIAMTMIFGQSISIIAYTVVSPKYVDRWVSFFIMLGISIAIWVIAIYIFIEQNVWISAVCILVWAVITSLYSSWEIGQIGRYILNDEERIMAIIQFYGDPLLILMGKLRHCHCCSSREEVLSTNDFHKMEEEEKEMEDLRSLPSREEEEGEEDIINLV